MCWRGVRTVYWLLAVALLASCQEGSGVVERDAAWSMESYVWANRPVVLFADDAGDAELVRQRGLLDARAAGLAERDMVLVEAVGGGVRVQGRGVAASAAALRERYGVADDAGFVFLLVGKDGGVKLRRGEAVDSEELFAVIDAMPMRRREMGER